MHIAAAMLRTGVNIDSKGNLVGKDTKIQWARSTFSPWIGCTRVSPDCDHCYAEAWDRRYKGALHWGPGQPRMHTSLKYWEQPAKWNEEAARTRSFWPVFGGSMCDVFDNEVDDSWRTTYWKLIERTPALTWLLLTKRIGNVMRMVPSTWRTRGFPHHVWIMMTCGEQELFDRDWPKLAEIPSSIRGVSVEPMRGPVVFPQECAGRLDWAIYGGESTQAGAEPRPCRLEWFEQGIENCRELGVRPFIKQLGDNATYAGKRMLEPDDMSTWPAHLRIQEWPKPKVASLPADWPFKNVTP